MTVFRYLNNPLVHWFRPVLLVISLACIGCNRASHSDTSNMPQTESAPSADNHSSGTTVPRGTAGAHTDANALEYWVLVSKQRRAPESGFNDDTSLEFYGEPLELEECVPIFVNGSPVELLVEDAKLFRINEWLVAGKNSVSIRGKLENGWYLKVIALRSNEFFHDHRGHFEKVVAKMRIPATVRGSDTAWPSLSFDADIAYCPFFDSLTSEAKTKEQVENEIQKQLVLAFDLLAKHDWNAYQTMMIAPWNARPRWGVSREAFAKGIEEANRRVVDHDWEFLTKVGELKFIVGERTVICYSGRRKLEEGIPMELIYSLAWKNRKLEQEHLNAPLRLVRVNGRWEEW